eukprot:323935-Chlamydomonas_euryale.AAC.1
MQACGCDSLSHPNVGRHRPCCRTNVSSPFHPPPPPPLTAKSQTPSATAECPNAGLPALGQRKPPLNSTAGNPFFLGFDPSTTCRAVLSGMALTASGPYHCAIPALPRPVLAHFQLCSCHTCTPSSYTFLPHPIPTPKPHPASPQTHARGLCSAQVEALRLMAELVQRLPNVVALLQQAGSPPGAVESLRTGLALALRASLTDHAAIDNLEAA